jgi:hypothetical protein
MLTTKTTLNIYNVNYILTKKQQPKINKNTFQTKKHLHNRKKFRNFAPQISVHWRLYVINVLFLVFISLNNNKLNYT